MRRSDPDRLESLSAAVKKAGIKLTAQRLEIFKELAGTDQHPDAEAVFKGVKKRMPTVSLDTVYRTLWMLRDLGLLSTLGPSAGILWLTYLPMFLIGSAIAAGWERLPDIPRLTGWLLCIAALFGVTCAWWIPARTPGYTFTSTVVLLSAGTLVVVAGKWLPAERVLLGPIPRELGRVSFSLYLVHEPIAVSVAKLLPADHPWITPLISIPLGLVAAFVFARFVELPAHRMAKGVAKRLSSGGSPANHGRRAAGVPAQQPVLPRTDAG